MLKINKKLIYSIMASFLMTVLIISPEAAFANALSTTISNGLCVVVEALTGEVGQAIATLAVLFLGIGAFFGKVNWGLALMFASGIVAIFGAASIAGAFGSGGSGC
jgi:type IV secretory pathway VirB2 component (pilin)